MRVTKEIAEIYYHSYTEGACSINNVGARDNWDMMSEAERENVRVLEFPKIIRHNGKSYKVDDIFFNNLMMRGMSIKKIFPKLKKVIVPKECDLYGTADGVEIVTY